MPEAYCANCDTALKTRMIRSGWGMCDPCKELESRDYAPLLKTTGRRNKTFTWIRNYIESIVRQ